MREGRWRLSCDCILLVKGMLANGQHRMAAIVASGVSNQFIIMESNDDELYRVIDCGRKRTVADVFTSVDNANRISSIAQWVVKYDKGLLVKSATSGSQRSHDSTSRGDILEFIESNLPVLAEIAALVMPLYAEKKIIPISQSGALAFIGFRKNKTKTQQFITNLYTGNSREDSCWDYREKCLRNSTSKAKLPPGTMFALGIKCLRSYLNGSRLGVLKMLDGETFPQI